MKSDSKQPDIKSGQNKGKTPVKNLSEMFTLFYSKMPSVVLCNLIFALPSLALIFLGYYAMKNWSMGAGLTTVFLCGVAVYLLYCGVNSVSLDLLDKTKKPVIKSFFSGIVRRLPMNLINAAVVVLCVFIAVSSFFYYRALTEISKLYFIFFVFYVIFIYIMLFAVSHLPLLTLKFNRGFAETYKTAIAMIVRNGVNNFTLSAVVTLIAVIAYFCVSLTRGVWYLTLIMGFALLLIIPAFVALLTNFLLFSRTDEYLNPHMENAEKLNRPATGKAVSGGVPTPAQQGEYVFYNGKMIKKEQLEKELGKLNKEDE